MNLHQLKKQLQKTIGLINYNLSNEDLKQIVNNAKGIPLGQIDEPTLQKIVSGVTGVTSFLLVESLDTSDIDHIIRQIEVIISQLDENE
jgi:hypothetical protein